MMDTIINETAKKYMPTIWEFLPEGVRDECVLKALEESPKFLSGFMDDVKEHIDDIFDLKTMVIEVRRLWRQCIAHEITLNPPPPPPPPCSTAWPTNSSSTIFS